MKHKLLLSAAGAAAAMFIAVGAAQAAPATGSLDSLKLLGSDQSTVEKARCWRRCWRHRGHWHCRRWCRWRRWW